MPMMQNRPSAKATRPITRYHPGGMGTDLGPVLVRIDVIAIRAAYHGEW